MIRSPATATAAPNRAEVAGGANEELARGDHVWVAESYVKSETRPVPLAYCAPIAATLPLIAIDEPVSSPATDAIGNCCGPDHAPPANIVL